MSANEAEAAGKELLEMSRTAIVVLSCSAAIVLGLSLQMLASSATADNRLGVLGAAAIGTAFPALSVHVASRLRRAREQFVAAIGRGAAEPRP